MEIGSGEVVVGGAEFRNFMTVKRAKDLSTARWELNGRYYYV